MPILDPKACGFAKVAVHNTISVSLKWLPNEMEIDFQSRLRLNTESFQSSLREYRKHF